MPQPTRRSSRRFDWSTGSFPSHNVPVSRAPWAEVTPAAIAARAILSGLDGQDLGPARASPATSIGQQPQAPWETGRVRFDKPRPLNEAEQRILGALLAPEFLV